MAHDGHIDSLISYVERNPLIIVFIALGTWFFAFWNRVCRLATYTPRQTYIDSPVEEPST